MLHIHATHLIWFDFTMLAVDLDSSFVNIETMALNVNLLSLVPNILNGFYVHAR